jgi:Flp pilus assembly CpaF family ATPase
MALLRAFMTGHAGSCTLHADSPSEALERLSTLLGSEKNVSPRDAVRMIVSSVDLLVQIRIVDEIRRVTAIARLGKGQRAGEASITTLWRYDDNSTPDQPAWHQVEEKENISWT